MCLKTHCTTRLYPFCKHLMISKTVFVLFPKEFWEVPKICSYWAALPPSDCLTQVCEPPGVLASPVLCLLRSMNDLSPLTTKRTFSQCSLLPTTRSFCPKRDHLKLLMHNLLLLWRFLTSVRTHNTHAAPYRPQLRQVHRHSILVQMEGMAFFFFFFLFVNDILG
jgi:hypothetical protein